MLAAARAAGARRFVHCSTIGVYGHVAGGPADEQSPFHPRDAYQESKVKAEEACWKAMASGEMEVTIIRPCSIYGPGDLRMLKMFEAPAERFLMIGTGEPIFTRCTSTISSRRSSRRRNGRSGGRAFIIGGPRYLPLAVHGWRRQLWGATAGAALLRYGAAAGASGLHAAGIDALHRRR